MKMRCDETHSRGPRFGYLYEIFVGALFLHARIVVTMIRELSERAASEY